MKFCWHNAKENRVKTREDRIVFCKDCVHLCYEDLGIYYCGNLGICGQLSPDDYCSRGERKEKRHENH